MNLTESTDLIRVVTSSAANLSVVACFVDAIDASAKYGSQTTSISSATTTTIVAAPSGQYSVRRIEAIRIANTHASTSNTVTVQFYNGSAFVLWSGVIAAGEVLGYDGKTFTLFNTSGVPKLYGVNSPNTSSVMVPPLFATANLTGVKTITSGSTFAVYVGKAPRAITSATIRCRVTTAVATITWAEVAIATGTINVGANPTLYVRGWTDVSGTFNSTGQKSVSVSVASGQAINEGDDLWVLIGNAATTAAIVRAMSIADDTQVGVRASLATRPSLNVGTGQAYTIEGATTLAAWVSLVV